MAEVTVVETAVGMVETVETSKVRDEEMSGRRCRLRMYSFDQTNPEEGAVVVVRLSVASHGHD